MKMSDIPYNDNITAGVAVAAVSSPLWDQWLHDVSDVAASLLPILGAIWLLVQAVVKIKETWFQ